MCGEVGTASVVDRVMRAERNVIGRSMFVARGRTGSVLEKMTGSQEDLHVRIP